VLFGNVVDEAQSETAPASLLLPGPDASIERLEEVT
jgi:hypothetical protein